MKVFKDLEQLPNFKNAVVTIGSYDGVHAGHQAIIQRINTVAQQLGGESVLITFHPHPRFVVRPNDPFRLINTIEEKEALLRRYGVDNLIIVPFTKAFSQQTPEEYIEDFLVNRFHPKMIAIGYDHKFGNNRAGDIHFLKSHASRYGYQVMEIQQQDVDSIVVSSTKIRQALEKGEVALAKEWLGHPFVISGKVVKGQQIGRTIGYPTANIMVSDGHKLIPPEGIYAVEVWHKELKYGGMLYIGKRPTVDDGVPSIEVNIFDFEQDIYGDSLTVELVQRIRDDEKYNSLEELQQQLAIDKINSLEILKRSTGLS